MSKTHYLKVWPEYYRVIKTGEKKFEIRKNDRNFKVGDTLILQEWSPMGYSSVSPNTMTGEYTGHEISANVSYVLKDAAGFGLISGYCVLSISI